jgi:hypothetical protein
MPLNEFFATVISNVLIRPEDGVPVDKDELDEDEPEG